MEGATLEGVTVQPSTNAVITAEVIAAYATDGVVCLRGVINQDWIGLLGQGLDRNRANPSDRGRLWNRNAEGHTTFYDSQCWQSIDEYRRFVMESPLAALAGLTMAVDAVNFYFDAIFTRSPGTQFRTPFHQDEPYWSVDGFDCSSAWMPLDPVERRSALEFVRGSHRWPDRYRQQNFGALTDDERDQVIFDDDAVPFPDIDGDRDAFDIVSWDMEPGDVALFNARMIHGGSGLLAPDRRLRVFNTQWLGDDVRIAFRSTGMDPDHSQAMTAAGLSPGDRVGGPLYPELWRRPR